MAGTDETQVVFALEGAIASASVQPTCHHSDQFYCAKRRALAHRLRGA